MFEIRNQVRITIRDIIETFDTLTTDDVTILNSLLEVLKALVMDIASLTQVNTSPTTLVEISIPGQQNPRSVKTRVFSCPRSGSNDQVQVYIQTVNTLNIKESIDGVAIEALCEDGKSKVEIFTDSNGIANLGYFSLGRSIGITTKLSGYVDSATLITVTDDDKPSVIELAKLEYVTNVGNVSFRI